MEGGSHRVGSRADRSPDRCVCDAGRHQQGSEIEGVLDRYESFVLSQPLCRAAFMKVLRELFFARVDSGISHIDAPFSQLFMDRLTLIEGTEKGHLTTVGRSQLLGGLDDSRIVTLGERDPAADSRRAYFEIFEKTHNPSPPDIVA
jgi:hypothetical protein